MTPLAGTQVYDNVGECGDWKRFHGARNDHNTDPATVSLSDLSAYGQGSPLRRARRVRGRPLTASTRDQSRPWFAPALLGFPGRGRIAEQSRPVGGQAGPESSNGCRVALARRTRLRPTSERRADEHVDDLKLDKGLRARPPHKVFRQAGTQRRPLLHPASVTSCRLTRSRLCNLAPKESNPTGRRSSRARPNSGAPRFAIHQGTPPSSPPRRRAGPSRWGRPTGSGSGTTCGRRPASATSWFGTATRR